MLAAGALAIAYTLLRYGAFARAGAAAWVEELACEGKLVPRPTVAWPRVFAGVLVVRSGSSTWPTSCFTLCAA